LNGLRKLIYVDIALDRTKDNPQRIFESLNSTGLDLSQADLIRNYILMGMTRDDQEFIYKNYWEIIEQNTRDESQNKTFITEFIRDYLTLKNKDIPAKKDVYEKFKKQYPITTIEALKDVLAELKSLSKLYYKLLNPEKEIDKEIRRYLRYINQLEMIVSYPFLMKAYEDYITAKIDKITFVNILKLLLSYVWRRFIVGLPTNALNKVFMTLYDRVKFDNYLLSLQKSLVQKSSSQKFPTNNEVIAAIKEKDMYNISAKNKKYFFECIENHNNNEPVGLSKLTFEHIFPQKPHPKWKQDLEETEYNQIKERYLHTIGNLTYSGNNGELGNKSFLEKRDMNIEDGEQGYKYSKLWLNRDLQNIDVWNLNEVERRIIKITERTLKVWEYPELQTLNDENEEINIFDIENQRRVRGKKLEYYIFEGHQVFVPTITHMYINVLRRLFERNQEVFFNTNLKTRLLILSDPLDYGNRGYDKINDTYYLCLNFSSYDKIERLKEALTLFSLEEELYIKFSSNEDEPEDANLSGTKQRYLEFWAGFKPYLEKNSTKIKAQKPLPQHWSNISIGISQVHIDCIVAFQSYYIYCGIYIPDNKELFKKLHNNKDKIEQELGFNLRWEELPDKKASRLKYSNYEINLETVDGYEECYKWLQETAEKYYDVMQKYW
jgi:hypothetical protein